MTHKSRRLARIVFSVYLMMLVWLILFKLSTDFSHLPTHRHLNLIPLAESVRASGRLNWQEIVFNILAFVPLGVYVGLFRPAWPLWRKILLGFCLSFCFEMIQFLFAIGVSDITDLLGNTLGGALGVLILYLLRRWLDRRTCAVVNGLGLAAELIMLAMAVLLYSANS